MKRYISLNFGFEVRLSRQNVFLRDEMMCQYCLRIFSEKKLTIDHVLPLSKGGKHSWTNVVTACSKCNNKKSDKTPDQAHMPLIKLPTRPQWLPSRELFYKAQNLPPTWQAYLELEEQEEEIFHDSPGAFGQRRLVGS